MNHRIRRSAFAAALIAPAGLLSIGLASSSAHAAISGTTIYTETNSVNGNQILAFRSTGGVLTQVGTYATGSNGSGSSLGSQSAIATAGARLFAVNAGSNTLSVFTIDSAGALTLLDVKPTGGVKPVSVAIHGQFVYVLNAGDGTVSGYRMNGGGLEAINAGHQTLPGSGGAQISFDRTGRRLVVTEKATGTIDVLPVANGVAGAAVSNPSTGQTPFGFAIDQHNHIVVSNAAGGTVGASSASSYSFSGDATINPISSAVATSQTAACWIALSRSGKFAFTTNTASGTISSYQLAADGTLTLANATAASPGVSPLDMVVAGDSLFTLNSKSQTITTSVIGASGTLNAGSSVAIPVGSVGLATS